MPTDLKKGRILDKTAYDKYIKLLDHPMFGKDRFIHTSDEDISIDPHMNKGAISNSLRKLPRAERKLINQKVAVWRLSWDKLHALKVKALGAGKKGTTVMHVLEERKEELIEHFGSYRTYDEIMKVIRLDWGYDCGKTTLIKFKSKYKDQITTSTVQFHKDHSHLRLSHKRGRLEELEKIYSRRKKKYEENPSLANERQLQSIILQISKEVEDKTIRVEADIRQTIEQNINVKIQQEVMGGMPVNDIIIARAAHKMGVNPTFILSRLHNSLYATMTGAKPPKDELENEEIVYPSSMVYNWKDIRKQHEDHGDVGLELAEYEDVTEENKEMALSLKEQMKAKILENKTRLAETQEKLREEDLDK